MASVVELALQYRHWLNGQHVTDRSVQDVQRNVPQRLGHPSVGGGGRGPAYAAVVEVSSGHPGQFRCRGAEDGCSCSLLLMKTVMRMMVVECERIWKQAGRSVDVCTTDVVGNITGDVPSVVMLIRQN